MSESYMGKEKLHTPTALDKKEFLGRITGKAASFWSR